MERRPEPPATPAATPPPVDPALEARKAFQNPGGMWAPAQMDRHVVTLRELGMQIDPQTLTDPMAFPLGAVVWLGGCSASFVSPEGLIITNHHCATGALQLNTVGEQNVIRDGFLARTRAEEKSNGPAARVYVTQAFRDVTAEVREGIEEIADPNVRHDTVERRQKELTAACEKDRPELRCSVVAYFNGEQYVLIEQLEIRDVRLAYAPADGIGNFGGEVDNWRWPRHSGDYTFFRAYVGPDGKPADYSPDNVPYRPKHHLKIASEPLKPHDLVLVAGYPGRTSRLATAAEVTEAVDWYYPRRKKMCEDYLALLDRLAAESDELARKGHSLRRGLSNVLTNTEGMLDGLVRGGLAATKAADERELREWAMAEAKHRDLGAALDRLASANAEHAKKRERRAATREAVAMSAMLSAADTIVHMALERPKPDAERDPAFQERNHKRIEQATRQAQQSYARRLDQEKLRLALLRAARLPADQRPVLLELIVGKGKEPTAEAIDAALTAMYSATKLEDAEARIELLRTATMASLGRSRDPFIQLALKVRPILQQFEDEDEAYAGATMLDRIAFVTALRDKQGGVLAPDANRTLRITYGTVRGYRPSPAAEPYEPFTGLTGMVKKHTGKPPFDAPERLLDAAMKGPYGPYVAPQLGEVPVDFLADLDITGGNSGSPTLNARGELVGLAFDGNYEAMASDWLFLPEITRSIHVDIRYALWIMDRVDGADQLLREMGVEPSID